MSTVPFVLEPDVESEINALDTRAGAFAAHDAYGIFSNIVGGACLVCESQANNLGPGPDYVAQTDDNGKKSVDKLTTSDEGIEFIKSYEGFEGELYNDAAGHATIGYGHLLHLGEITKEDREKYKNGITKDEATKLLKEDIERVSESAIKRQVTVKLNQNEFDALSAFTFNLGEPNLEKSTLKNKINSGTATNAEITKEFNKWNRAGGKELKGLTRRRKAEANIYTDGIYENNK